MSYQTKTLREQFSEEYFQTRNYRDYLNRKFDALARDVVAGTETVSSDTIIDFGCGYGGLANALYEQGYRNIFATDMSHWAIEHGQIAYPHLAMAIQFYNRNLLRTDNRLLIMLDVLEHMPEYEIEIVLGIARIGSKGKVAVRVPVCASAGERFVLPVSNNDPTHITCHTKEWWHDTFAKHGFTLWRWFSAQTIYDSEGVLAVIYEPESVLASPVDSP